MTCTMITANAIHVISKLEPLSACRDTEALLAAVKPPEDPVVRRAVDEARDSLARVVALTEAGRYDEGLQLARDVVG